MRANVRYVGRDPDGRLCGIALKNRLGIAYDERAFQFFLNVERKRAERTGVPFLLALVDVTDPPWMNARMDPAVASRVFSGLWRCLRETDFIGWYREDRVVGALVAACKTNRQPTCVVAQRTNR